MHLLSSCQISGHCFFFCCCNFRIIFDAGNVCFSCLAVVERQISIFADDVVDDDGDVEGPFDDFAKNLVL